MQEQSLPLHIAKAGVDYFFSTNKSRHIRFYGPGEPTQEFELMKEIVNYARSKVGNKLSTELQTNGYFGENVRRWLLDNLNIIWVSFDGEPDIHDAFRPCANGQPSSPIIEENVRWLIENTGNRNLMVGARVTITSLNVRRQIQIVKYFYSLGIRYVWTDPMFPSVGAQPICEDKENSTAFHFDMDMYVDGYIEAYKYGKSIGLFYGSFLTCNFDGKCNKHCRACTPVPHFTTDGYVSACDLVTFGKEAHHMDCFVYGKWDEENQMFKFDDEKIKQLQNRSTDNMQHCTLCSAEAYCGGYCLGEVMNETGSMYGQKVVACKAIRRLLDEMGIRNETYDYMHP